jgi:DNA-binding SARP family transcriptional activator
MMQTVMVIFLGLPAEKGKEKVFLHLIQNPEILRPETFKLQLYSRFTKSVIDFKLPVKKQNKLHLIINYNAEEKKISISCNGIEKSLNGINLDKVRSNIVFGLWGLDEDVAAMTLSNIRIKENNNTTYFWPLNEYDGNDAYEKITGLVSEVHNPEWLRKDHYHWKKLRSFKSDEMAGVIYKESVQEFNIINKDSMVIYSPYSDSFKIVNYSNRRPFSQKRHFSTYNESKNQIISYDFKFLKSPPGKKLYSILDEESMEWSSIDTTISHLNNHHHCSCWNTADETFTTFAGYSDFTYYNDFNSFDFSTNTWTNIKMEGDVIFPREYTVVGQEKETGLIYVFGGYGNENGQQAFGGQIFNDLFSVDLSNKSIKKLMEFEDFNMEYVPRGSIIPGNKEGTIFYTLMGPKKYELDIRLFEINLTKKTILPISDTIKFNSGPHRKHMRSKIFLYKDNESEKLYCVCRELKGLKDGVISFYSLKFPPSNLPEITPVNKLNNYTLLLSGVGAIVLLFFGVFIIRKRRISLTNKSNNNNVEYFRQNINAIWFLGGFQVFDSKGTDITYRFSKKLKELFVLILLETVQNRGINSKELSDKLWPGMDNTQQKNNRGVTINAVRKVLEDIRGISLDNVNNKWIIICDDDCYFDYAQVKNLLPQKKYLSQSDKIISLLNYGNLTPRLHFQWLDNIKAKYESEIVSYLHEICDYFISSKNYLSCIDTAIIIHEKYDELDEMALSYKINALNKIKGHSKAQNEFELFKKRYFAIYKEEYTKTIDNFVRARY